MVQCVEISCSVARSWILFAARVAAAIFYPFRSNCESRGKGWLNRELNGVFQGPHREIRLQRKVLEHITCLKHNMSGSLSLSRSVLLPLNKRYRQTNKWETFIHQIVVAIYNITAICIKQNTRVSSKC